jgi:hypothetical protein
MLSFEQKDIGHQGGLTFGLAEKSKVFLAWHACCGPTQPDNPGMPM